jgi:hypothetical protein
MRGSETLCVCCTDGASVDGRPPDRLVESGGLGSGPHRGDLRNFHARSSLTENTRSPSVSETSLRVIKHRICNSLTAKRAQVAMRSSCAAKKSKQNSPKVVSRRHLESLNQKQGNNLQRDYPYPDLLRAFEVSVEGLESNRP